jgi:hypothetical protein
MEDKMENLQNPYDEILEELNRREKILISLQERCRREDDNEYKIILIILCLMLPIPLYMLYIGLMGLLK